MAMWKHITCKLGNMRKEADFVLYPQNADSPHLVLIQSDKRCCRVDLQTNKGLLSDGKGGHPGFIQLSPQLGAKLIEVPADIVERLKALVNNQPQVGPVVVTGPVTVMVG